MSSPSLNLPVDIARLIFGYVIKPTYKFNNLKELFPRFNDLDNLTDSQAEYLLKNPHSLNREVWKKIKPIICKLLTPRKIISYLSNKESKKAMDIIMGFPNWEYITHDCSYLKIIKNPFAKKMWKVMGDIERAEIEQEKIEESLIRQNGDEVSIESFTIRPRKYRPSGFSNVSYITEEDCKNWFIQDCDLSNIPEKNKHLINDESIYMNYRIFLETPDTRLINRIVHLLY